MKFIRIAASIAAMVALAIPIASHAQAAGEKPVRGGSLMVGFASDAKTLDPLFSVQSTERQVLYLVFNSLVKFGKDFSIKPELAESWDVSKDGKRVVFKLRKGVKFQDGTVFDAAAVKWNLETRLDPAVASSQRDQLAPIIASIDVVDPNTVAINMKGSFPGLLSLFGERPGFMVSPTAWQKNKQDFGNHPVGTGPYIFKEWVRGSQLRLERNPDYWEKQLPYLEKITFSDIGGSVAGVQRLITGEVDFVPDLSPQDIRQIETRPGIRLTPIEIGRWYSLQWQVDRPPFNNLKLRQAIAHAIDRKRINDIVMRGKGTVSDSPTPAGLWWSDPTIKSLAYDPAKAKALLAEAGYANGLSIQLSTPQIGVFQQINQLVQEQLGAIGIQATLSPISSNDWYARIVDGATNFTPTRWTQRPDPDGLLGILFDEKGYANSTKYSNKNVSTLLGKARETYNQAERKSLYSQAQKQIVEDLPMLPLFFSTEYAAMQEKVRGFEWIPDQIPRFREVWKAN